MFDFVLARIFAVGLMFSVFAAGMAHAQQAEDGGASAAAERIDIDADSFVEGNLYFVAYHELGHALVSEFDLAVVGREEDAVDALATYLMTPDDQQTRPDYLMGAIKGWFLFAAETKLSDISWWDEHGTSHQRAFQIACLLYGYDPKAFKDAAEVVHLPEDRRASCERDAAQSGSSWEALLEEDSYAADEKVPDTVKAPAISYESTEKFKAQRDYLKQLGFLEDIGEFMRTSYKLKPGIQLVATECGQVNAFWSGDKRALVVCYELVAAYQAMAANMETLSTSEEGAEATEDDTSANAEGEPASEDTEAATDGETGSEGSGSGGNVMNGKAKLQ